MFEPLVALMPQVKAPSKEEQQRLKIETRLFWTVMALLVYLVCSQVPLYGVNKGGMSDPFYLMRVILASNKGTLMELGISPIITSGTIMQVRRRRGRPARARHAPAARRPPQPVAHRRACLPLLSDPARVRVLPRRCSWAPRSWTSTSCPAATRASTWRRRRCWAL